MATLLLAAGGQALGGALGLGGLGGLLGKAAGALAGGVVDQALFGGSSRTVETGRLADLSVQSSSEGAALPKVYGRVRLAGQVIWATRFEEVISEEEQGGKGGGGSKVTVRSYSYFGNFAVGVCEGEIARIGRIWADGKLLDTRALQMRIYTGSGDQLPDPLLSALQETAPAYRGTAYVVFERLALEPFGNRLPQLSFEVIRPVEPLENQIRAVTIIPGAGEFAYAPQVVSEVLGPGQQRPLNRHVEAGSSDWTESMDELQALCPNLKRVALVVAWFGEDLRAEHCRIRPKVEDNLTQTSGGSWSVAGLNRQSAVPVSETDGRPSYGGTPSDSSVIAAIRDLKDRGLEVMLYPFVLMDIAPGNSLPGPDGGTGQPAFPWRGRIVAGPDAAQSISAFMGTVSASDFSTAPGSVAYAGPDEWTFRRHILHMAALAKAAGGVESLLIGTEMRGLTRAQAGNGVYPFVDALKALAAEVRALVGPDTKLSYAADWSEYGAHQVSADELRFPLDPLWADPSIDFIGIDNYLPLTDLRDGAVPETPDDLALYRDRIAAGEYFDWYYASDADRKAGVRTPITDGAYGKPWVYRAKDLEGFWQNEHFERVGGAELGSATAWQPASKPIRFTELGFPAVDRGTNQPNVFIDPKSSESMLPHFSRGGRDDALQRRALEAHLSWWSASHPVLPPGTNPVSPVYGAPMVDPDGIYLWTWDARPFPAFPTFKEVWADGDNWQRGHWLTGRLGGLSLSGLISALLADYGVPPGDITVSGLDGGVDGYVLSGPLAARDVLEPLLDAFGGIASDRGTHIHIGRSVPLAVKSLAGPDFAMPEAGGDSVVRQVRAQSGELPGEVRLGAWDIFGAYQKRLAASRRLEGGSLDIQTIDLPASSSPDRMQIEADRKLNRLWRDRERITFETGIDQIALEPGDVVELSSLPGRTAAEPLLVRLTAVEDTDRRRFEAVRTGQDLATGAPVPLPGQPYRPGDPSPPAALFLDLPKLRDDDPDDHVRLAAFAKPWPGGLQVLRSPASTGFEPLLTVPVPAVMGITLTELMPGPLWVLDRRAVLDVKLFGGTLTSLPLETVLAGRNALAVRCRSGGFEILQFTTADLIAPSTYRLSGLLRGQKGTEPEMQAGADPQADTVVLSDGRNPLVPLDTDASGLTFHYRLLPQGAALDDPSALALTHRSNQRAARPLAPIHIRARREAAGIRLSWIRQTRTGGDSWEQAEVPLGEESEAYDIRILSSGGGAVLRALSSGSPSVLYPEDDITADFGAVPTHLSVAVAQVSPRAGRGDERKAVLHV